jgi:pyruvate/2-oxoglutarate/acetoin dehydrogenase E1 component
VTATTSVRYVDAVRIALAEALESDDRVVVLGQDVTSGGPFGATIGLAETFGAERIRDTPISEAAVAGMAVGAAVLGRRPILELMFMDFVTLALDQIVNHAAKLRYMTGGQLSVPLTIRVQGGAVGGFGAHHSQSLEAWFAHVPGLRIVAPSTPSDARHLLAAAIRSDDPTIVIEHRGLYWSTGPIDDGAAVDPTRAVVRRSGSDVTVVSWSRMSRTSMEAAELAARAGVEVEVVDVRSLSPLDVDTIVASVRRTGRLLIASEAVMIGGFGAEIAAAVARAAGDALRAPVERVGAPFCPVPAAIQLERAYVPSAEHIAGTVTQMVASRAVDS